MARAFAFRFVLLVFIWWLLADGGGWGFGLASAAVVAGVSLRLAPPTRWPLRAQRIPAFIGYFLLQSMLAGMDVAQRTLRPSMPLRPTVLRLPLSLPPGAPTWWLMLVISLLPGTLSVHLDEHGGENLRAGPGAQSSACDDPGAGAANERVLELHCLDDGPEVIAGIRDAERRIALLFGVSVEPAARATC